MGRMSRAKGARGEREWAQFLRGYGLHARRGQQFSGSPDSPDVVCGDMPIHWEVKRTESLSVYKALEQASNDCGTDNTPVVAHRRSRRDWLVILTAEDFMTLLGKEPNGEAVTALE